jgi:hypothetical protein
VLIHNNLYLPGHKEGGTKKDPGEKIKLASENTGIAFRRLISPGDPLYPHPKLATFSLSSSQEMFEEEIIKIIEYTSIYVYSLSVWPALLALENMLEANPDLEALIKKVVFLNPAKDPLHAVKIMDWILRD